MVAVEYRVRLLGDRVGRCGRRMGGAHRQARSHSLRHGRRPCLDIGGVPRQLCVARGQLRHAAGATVGRPFRTTPVVRCQRRHPRVLPRRWSVDIHGRRALMDRNVLRSWFSGRAYLPHDQHQPRVRGCGHPLWFEPRWHAANRPRVLNGRPQLDRTAH